MNICFQALYDPKNRSLYMLRIQTNTEAFQYHKPLNVIIFSQLVFSGEVLCKRQLRDLIIHLLQFKCERLPLFSLWGCSLKSVSICVHGSTLVHVYSRGSPRVVPFAHSRDRKWLQYGTEWGFLEGSWEWSELQDHWAKIDKVKNTDVLFLILQT